MIRLYPFAALVSLAAASACSSPTGPVPLSGPPTPGGPAGSVAPLATPSPSASADAATVDCQTSGTCTQCSYPGLTTLLPNTTNPALGVSDPTGQTYGTNPSAPYCFGPPHEGVAVNGLLLVFLPGSGAVPTQYQMILYQAQALGYHVLSLSWPNGATYDTDPTPRDLTDICHDQTQDPDCWGQVRANRYNGTAEQQPSPWTDPFMVPASGTNSIEYRLTKALVHLGWSDWLTGPAGQRVPNWAKIVVAGHSQGGGEAAFIGTQQNVQGVITFSSPDDATAPSSEWTCTANPANPPPPPATLGPQPTVAQWVQTPFASTTPLTSYFGLVLCTDPGFSQVVTVWNQLAGPPGSPAGYDPGTTVGAGVSVDTNPPPYDFPSTTTQSHQLFTSLGPTDGDGNPVTPVFPSIAAHDATVVDCGEPVDSSMPSCTTYATPLCPAPYSTITLDGGTSVPNPRLKTAWQEMLISVGGLTAKKPKCCDGSSPPCD